MNKITIEAHAKINLALAVKYKRPDGYHEIESIFQEINFSDQLIIGKADRILFQTDSPILKNKDTNLCLQAARLLKKEYHISGLSIDLKKQIPIGAGLGGGSSDAAAILKSGIQLFHVKIRRKKLLSLAAQLGSDVPFFMHGKTALISGRGEIIRQLKSNKIYYILLVIPDLAISTSWAYKNLKLGLTKNKTNLKLISLKFLDLNVDDFGKYFRNDFENLVFEVHPQLEKIKRSLYKEGADYASLSGSGSSMYGIFRSKEVVQKVFNLLSMNYKCILTHPVLS
jgi:4-diphosphocytidyl-2-C-methyl-D-erythritol kinase